MKSAQEETFPSARYPPGAACLSRFQVRQGSWLDFTEPALASQPCLFGVLCQSRGSDVEILLGRCYSRDRTGETLLLLRDSLCIESRRCCVLVRLATQKPRGISVPQMQCRSAVPESLLGGIPGLRGGKMIGCASRCDVVEAIVDDELIAAGYFGKSPNMRCYAWRPCFSRLFFRMRNRGACSLVSGEPWPLSSAGLWPRRIRCRIPALNKIDTECANQLSQIDRNAVSEAVVQQRIPVHYELNAAESTSGRLVHADEKGKPRIPCGS